mmetsp:Transcript_20889/g.31160  ORF Transcript_20889/g.31160 Transcript_20889/m.31160 type:complete len:271 (-) Transcript_20889:279-1091(-)
MSRSTSTSFTRQSIPAASARASSSSLEAVERALALAAREVQATSISREPFDFAASKRVSTRPSLPTPSFSPCSAQRSFNSAAVLDSRRSFKAEDASSIMVWYCWMAATPSASTFSSASTISSFLEALMLFLEARLFNSSVERAFNLAFLAANFSSSCVAARRDSTMSSFLPRASRPFDASVFLMSSTDMALNSLRLAASASSRCFCSSASFLRRASFWRSSSTMSTLAFLLRVCSPFSSSLTSMTGIVGRPNFPEAASNRTKRSAMMLSM